MRTSFTTAARITSIAAFGCAFKVALLMLLLGGAVRAQETTTDGATPSGVAPGAPAGSFALSGFDNVNLYNGNLNFALPLLGVNGRGGARYGMTLNIERKWIVEKNTNEITGQTHYYPSDVWWDGRVPGYGPGILHGRKSGHLNVTCPAPPSGTIPRIYSKALTRLTFTAPDGTEFELRDQLNNGQPLSVPQVPACTTGIGPNRGRIFLTADGTSATFISDEDIFDYGLVGDQIVFYPSGYLMFRDGARYRIDNGSVTWMRDRNGNKLTLTYDSNGRVSSVTDSLNRQVTVAYDVSDVQPYGLCDQISYKGAGGASRIIRVSKTNLGAALRSGFALQTPGQLFALSDGTLATLYNPTVVSSLWLPDGNRRYQFFYNSYGELARVVLPTGGAIEYDHGPGLSDNTTGGFFTIGINRPVYRRVLERRVYVDGTTLESRQTYSRPENSAGNNLGYVIVDHLDAGGALLARQRHYFYGSPRSSFAGTPVSYSKWKEGREYRTESFDANGATLLQRSDTTWQQPVDGSAWPLTQPETSDGARPNNPQITQTTTTLPDTNQVAKQTFSYDSNNNQTDVWEYDFGPGAAPAYPTRHTHTDYLTSGYDTNTDIHLRNLPSQRLVYAVNTSTGAETLASHITYEYDLYDDSPNHAPLVDRPGISGLDGGFTTGYTTRGNVTRVSRWLDTLSSWIYTYAQYDIAGNVVKAIDANGNATTLDFRDCFGSPGDDARQNTPPAELNGQTSYAFATKVTNALGYTAYTKYDYYLGKTVTSEDANGIVSSVAYNDALDRPTQGIQARHKVGVVDVPAERRQTTFTYDDTNLVITMTSDLSTFADNVLTIKSYYDGLGRTWRGAAYEGATWTIKDMRFDALGRVSQVSNPYRAADPGSASPPAGLWTTTEYDALGRVIKVTTPDSAHVDTAYNGNQVTVTEQAGKKRRSETDALGRLVKVTEGPGALDYDTFYLYDALDHLRKVTQGAQTRWFAYDSLSRMIRAKNSEENTNSSLPAHTDPVTGASGWAMAYSYDTNGNLTQRIDARNLITNYSYDALNRNTGTDYLNGSQTSAVRRGYDGAVNGKGRLHYEWTQEGGVNATRTETDSYDARGRALTRRQSFWRGSDWGAPYVIQQSYDLAGNVKTVTYPSGRTINYSYDQAGRLNSFTGNLGDGINRDYATGMQYDTAGSMKREQFGTTIPLYHRRHYNNRGQLFDIRLGTDPSPIYDGDDLNAWQNATGSWNRGSLRLYYSTLYGCHVYGSGGTDNNGNPLRMDHHIPLDDAASNFVASIDRYDYDSLNRLKSVTELSYTKGPSGEDIYQGVFRQAFLYDRWGNRTIDQANTVGGVNKKAYTVDAATNRLTSVDGVAMSYDAAGNQTNDGSGQRIYDVENRVVEAYNTAGVRVSWYVYNAGGRRVARMVGEQGTWQVYGIGGDLLAEYAVGASPSAPQKEYGYRNGQLLVVWDGSETGDRQLQWLVQDHLGSTRMVVDRSGSLGGIRRHDFLPFGEELFAGVGIRSASVGYSGDSVRHRYTSKERDTETGLDYFGARYYGSVMGRFLSPDSLFVDQSEHDPQSWNLYAYVRNNPLRYIDPLGLARFDAQGNWRGEYDGEYDKQTGLYWNKKRRHWESPAEFRFRRGQEQLANRIGIVFQRLTFQSRFGNSDRTGARGLVGLAGAMALRQPTPPQLATSGLLLVGAGLAYLTNYNNAAPPVLVNPNIEARKADLEVVDYIADKYGVDRHLLGKLIHEVKDAMRDHKGRRPELSKEEMKELAEELAQEIQKGLKEDDAKDPDQ